MSVPGAAPAGRRLASGEQAAAWSAGVQAVLVQWTALRLTVQNGDSGRDLHAAVADMAGELVEWEAQLKQPGVYADEVLPYLETVMLEDYCTEVQDGSLPLVARRVAELHAQVTAGDYSGVEVEAQRARLAPLAHPNVVFDRGSDGESSSSGSYGSEGEGEDSEQAQVPELVPGGRGASRQPHVDEDGWATVAHSSRGPTTRRQSKKSGYNPCMDDDAMDI